LTSSNKACTAPKTLPCIKRGHKFRINHHFCHKCRGAHCRYLILLDGIPEYMLEAVRASV